MRDDPASLRSAPYLDTNGVGSLYTSVPHRHSNLLIILGAKYQIWSIAHCLQSYPSPSSRRDMSPRRP